LTGGKISILNVYAPTESRERLELWGELLATLPRDCRWLLCGDWNSVETKEDKSTSCGKIMPDAESQVFQQLKLVLKIEDTFARTSPIRFTWDNKRRDGIRVLARLDRIYSFLDAPMTPAPMAEYYIRGDSNHSDYLPVVGKFLLLAEVRRASNYKMNACFMDDEAIKVGVYRIWNANPTLEFTGKLRKVVKFYKEYSIRQARERRKEEAALRLELQGAVMQLQRDPLNAEVQKLLGDLSDKLQVFELTRAEGLRVKSRIKWKQHDDSCSKEFFKATREHSGASSITELEDEQGNVFTDQGSLEGICHRFYSKLYAARPQSAARAGAEEQALRGITDRLSAAIKERLRAPITLAELDAALQGMPSGKALGPEGVITEFYKKFWNLIKVDYMEMVYKAVRANRFPPGVTKGAITLLHKGQERGRLTNWRPITLLNVAYKLYAKTLQLRLQPVLMEIISQDQSAFLPLRFILDNILLTHETIDWAEHSGQLLVFLKLDFSKA
jgi:hypothetical protein